MGWDGIVRRGVSGFLTDSRDKRQLVARFCDSRIEVHDGPSFRFWEVWGLSRDSGFGRDSATVSL